MKLFVWSHFSTIFQYFRYFKSPFLVYYSSSVVRSSSKTDFYGISHCYLFNFHHGLDRGLNDISNANKLILLSVILFICFFTTKVTKSRKFRKHKNALELIFFPITNSAFWDFPSVPRVIRLHKI